MRRVFNLSLIGFTTVVSLCWTMDIAESSLPSLHPGLRERAVRLDRLQQEVNAFGALLDQTVKDLAQCRTTLRAASRVLEEYTAEHYPTYFSGLAAVDAEQSMRIKIARMLVRAIDEDAVDGKDHGAGPDRRAELSRKLAEMVADNL